MVSNQLEGCFSRVWWAGWELRRLDEAHRVWLLQHRPDQDGLVLEYYPDANVHAWRYRAPSVAVEWSLSIGNIVHQTRAALDNLIWQLVIHAGAQPSGSNQFPIFSSPKVFADRSPRYLQGVPAAWGALVESIQPYQDPDWDCHPLGYLATLSNEDKHRVLRLATSRPTGPLVLQAMSPTPLDGGVFLGDWTDGAIAAWAAYEDVAFNPAATIQLGPTAGILEFPDGTDVIEQLSLMITSVELLLQAADIYIETGTVGPFDLHVETILRLYDITKMRTAARLPLHEGLAREGS